LANATKKTAKSWGHTFIAIGPTGFVDSFDDKAASVIEAVKHSGDGIRIPREGSAKTAQERMEKGVLPIPEKVWQSIVATASQEK
jgi:LDH2 family malate/lactate/ureidoglycolate dehydrogenase